MAGHPNRGVDEDEKKAEEHEIADDTKGIGRAGDVSHCLAPGQDRGAEDDWTAVGNAHREIEDHRHDRKRGDSPQQASTNHAGSKDDVPRQRDDGRRNEQRGPRHPGKVILGTNPIFNTAGGLFIPLNENEIYITGVFGPVLISKPMK